MSTIVLKTAKRATSVPRLAMRKAVKAVYAGTIAATAAKTTTSTVVKLAKKAGTKKAS